MKIGESNFDIWIILRNNLRFQLLSYSYIMDCYRIDHKLSAARFIPVIESVCSFDNFSFKRTMRSDIEIPGGVPYLKSTTINEVSEIELLKSSNRKHGKKIFIGVLLLSAVIFCIVIILRYGGILKLRVHNIRLQNVIYQHGQNCVSSHRNDSIENFSYICPRNKK